LTFYKGRAYYKADMGFFDNILGKKDSAQPAPPPPAAKKILIVEDDGYIRDAYAEILRGEGFEVITAENGQLGLEATKANKPNLILLDLMLPIMDGKQMLHEVRQIPEFHTVPVIVLSNAGTADNIKETKFYDNANDFLIKANVTPKDVIDKVKTFI
jgi:DNA-binding response OmpR family regulator